jgi:hypothetical protein
MEAKLNDIKTPWEDPKDHLNRQQYAKFLTDYLSQKKSSFVLNLNAPWGMGKTYFITHWYSVIKNTHPAVYINAWESDFSSEPLVAVIASIRDQLKPYIPEKEFKSGIGKIISACGSIAKKIGPTLIKGAVKKVAGSEEGQDLIEFTHLSADEMANFAESSMKTLLMAQDKSIESVKEFQDGLGELLNSIDNKTHKGPMFVFIDELDRCRPTYAIELLETVKHLFSIDGIVFVIATDSHQLQHSIKAIYGNDFSGDIYLKRFFHQEYNLPAPDYLEYCRFKCCQLTLNDNQLFFGHFNMWNFTDQEGDKPENWGECDSLYCILFFYSRYFSLDLRAIDRIVLRFDAIIKTNTKKMDGVFLVLLLVFQEVRPGIIREIYDSITKNNWASYIKELEEHISKNGEKILWSHKEYYGDDVVNHEYTVQSIAKTYFNQISVEINKQVSAVDQVRSLEHSVTRFLIKARQKSIFVSYPDYFGLAEMA